MLMRRIAAAVLTLALLLPAVSAAAPAHGETVLLVETDRDPAELLSAVPGASLLCTYSLIDAAAVSVPAASAARAADALRALPGVTDVSVSASFCAPSGDAQAADTPELSRDDLVLRAAEENAGEGTLIAVLDTCFDTEHPAFALPASVSPAITEENFGEAVTDTYAVYREGRENIRAVYHSSKIPFAYDYANSDADVSGSSAHGTHVAAAAAASVAEGGALMGTAPGAQLALMKVFDDAGKSCREHALILAVEDAVRLGADVINLSLGSLAYTSEYCSMRQLANALRRAEEAGVLVVCAAGNDGRAGAMGLHSDLARASDPDYGLPSEPAALPFAFSVGAASNSVVYAGYLDADGRRIVYDETYEASEDTVSAFADVLGGKSFRLAVVPGVGTAEDFAQTDAQNALALIARGEISFAEKIANAAAAGAAGVIVYDAADGEPFLMSIGEAPAIPAVSVAAHDGAFLAARDGVNVHISDKNGAFAAAAGGIASFSSWGPASDLLLKPDICAVGVSVVSAVPGGGYAVMNGTSMASPQISGAAAVYISLHREELSALPASSRGGEVRRRFASYAEVLTDESGLPVSPRAQGAGVLRSWDAGIVMSAPENAFSFQPGDRCAGVLRLPVRLTNETDEPQRLLLTAPLLTDETELRDGVFYTTGASKAVPATLDAAPDAGVSVTDAGVLCTVPAGGTLEVSLTLSADAEYFASLAKLFPNGFYLDGFVIARYENGEHAASLPFLAFAGRWADAPMLDGGDWDGYESYYGGQLILRTVRGVTDTAGETADGVFSALFAFSPNGDRRADDTVWELFPHRNIAEASVEVYAPDGQLVYENVEFDLLKTAVEDGRPVPALLPLWDGSDGLNDHFSWEDGLYSVRVTFTSFSGGQQILTVPLLVDTERPRASECSAGDKTVRARFTDNHYLRQLRVYLPDPAADRNAPEEEKYLLDVRVSPAYEEGVHEAYIEAALPQGASYVYVSAEDYAGNLTVLRLYLD